MGLGNYSQDSHEENIWAKESDTLMADGKVKLVPISWHNGAWHGDGTIEYTPPEGWQVKDVKDFKMLSGNQNSVLIILEPINGN